MRAEEDGAVPFRVTEEDMDDAMNGGLGSRGGRRRRKLFEDYGDDDEDDDEEIRSWKGSKRSAKRGPDSGESVVSKPMSFVKRSVMGASMQVDDDDGEGEEEQRQRDEDHDQDDAPARTRQRRGLGRERQQEKGHQHHQNQQQNAGFSQYGIGSKLLRKMGWKEGGGLGKEGSGIAEPVEVKLRPKGRGLSYRFDEKTDQQKRVEVTRSASAFARQEGVATASEESGMTPQQRKLWKRGAAAAAAAAEAARARKGKGKVVYVIGDEDEEKRKGKDGAEEETVIIDMRGPKERVVRSVTEVLGPAEGEDSDEDAGPLKPLLHNVRLLADMAEAEEAGAIRKAASAKRSLEELRKERTAVSQSVAATAAEIATLESLAAAVSSADSPGDFAAIRSSFPSEWGLFGIDAVALSTALSALSSPMAAWAPLERPTLHSAEFTAWRHVLKADKVTEPDDDSDEDGPVLLDDGLHRGSQVDADSAAYVRLISDTFLPTVRRSILRWNPREPDSLVSLLRAWTPALPSRVHEELVKQLIVPRIASEIGRWDPRTDAVPVHAWLHSWLPFLPRESLEPLWATVRQKFAAVISSSWEAADPSAHSAILPWKTVFDPAGMESLVVRNVVPKLAAALRRMTVDSQSRSLVQFRGVVLWSDLVHPALMARLLSTEFMPVWAKFLAGWLLGGASRETRPDYGEIAEWYVAWRSAIPEQVISCAPVREQLMYALSLMDCALSGKPPLPPPSLAFREAEEPGVKKHTAVRRAGTSEAAVDLRDVMEQIAVNNDIAFLPTGRTHDGKPVFKFGTTSVVADDKLVFALDTATGKWRSVGLQQLIDQNRTNDPL